MPNRYKKGAAIGLSRRVKLWIKSKTYKAIKQKTAALALYEALMLYEIEMEKPTAELASFKEALRLHDMEVRELPSGLYGVREKLSPAQVAKKKGKRIKLKTKQSPMELMTEAQRRPINAGKDAFVRAAIEEHFAPGQIVMEAYNTRDLDLRISWKLQELVPSLIDSVGKVDIWKSIRFRSGGGTLQDPTPGADMRGFVRRRLLPGEITDKAKLKMLKKAAP